MAKASQPPEFCPWPLKTSWHLAAAARESLLWPGAGQLAAFGPVGHMLSGTPSGSENLSVVAALGRGSLIHAGAGVSAAASLPTVNSPCRVSSPSERHGAFSTLPCEVDHCSRLAGGNPFPLLKGQLARPVSTAEPLQSTEQRSLCRSLSKPPREQRLLLPASSP